MPLSVHQRRLAENIKADYIRSNPTPPNLTNNQAKNFRNRRNMNAWAHAISIASATAPQVADAVNRRVFGGSVRGSKKVAGGIRAKFSKPGNKYLRRR